MKTLDITRPDDWHLHLRDGEMLRAVTPCTSAHHGRAIIMPNLVPPVITGADAAAYRQRIQAAVPDSHDFEPLMTLYLTEASDPDDVEAAARAGIVTAVKLYPAGATTHSQSGVRDIDKVWPVLERMQKIDLPLLLHGEVTDPAVDIFDREAVFIERVLEPIRQTFPRLRIVMEHITTREAVDYVRAAPSNLAATITTHHLMINRNHMLVGGIRPHYYCLPIVKRMDHQQALREAAISGDARFFNGTDSAPHPVHAKESDCGCAGVFSALNSLACLAQVFEEEDALDRLEGFTSLHGPDYYRLPRNRGQLRLERLETPVVWPRMLKVGQDSLRVFDPGQPVYWRVAESPRDV